MSHHHPARSAFRFAAADGQTGAAPATASSSETQQPAAGAAGNEGATPHGETKAEKFKRLAGKRIENVGAAIDTLEKCFEPAGYEFTEEQVNKIASALLDRIGTMQKKALESLKPTSKPAL